MENPAPPARNRPVIAGMDWVDGGKQLGYGDYEQTTAKQRTNRERFLAEKGPLCHGRR